MMHIGFITPEYPHDKVPNAAGIGTSIKSLAKALIRNDVKVSIFIYNQNINEIFDDDGIKIHLIKSRKYVIAGFYFYRKHLQNYINRFLEIDKIVLLEAADWSGITTFMKLKVPLIIRLHGSDAYFCNLERRHQKIKNFMFEKLAIKGADGIIAPTKFAADLTRKIFNIKMNIVTIHNAIDLNYFTNSTPDMYDHGLILYIGTLIRKKGVFELPGIMKEVMKRTPQARLILIGSDSSDFETKSNSTWEMMRKEFDKEPLLNVTYLGKVGYQEIKNYIQRANICVFPTLAETLGMVTIEAMAMQKAVVSSDFGWVRELMEDGQSGFLIDPKNHENFGKKISDLINNNQLCISVGKQARLKSQLNFDMERVVLQNIDFYNNFTES